MTKKNVYTANLTNLRIAWTCPKCQHRNPMTPCQYDFDVDLDYNTDDDGNPGQAWTDGITFDDTCQGCKKHISIEIPTYKGKE